MKNYILTIICFITVSCQDIDSIGKQADLFFFDRPAAIWEEAFPLGNGRIGMMPDGGIEKEIIVLNEISMWSGGKQDTGNPQAYRSLAAIRSLLFEGKNDEAQELMYNTFVCKGEGSALGNGADAPYGSYQLFANLTIDYDYPSASAPVTAYKRELNLSEAVSTVSFKKGGVLYKREVLTSFSGDVGVIRLSADKDHVLQFTLGMNRPERAVVSVEKEQLVIRGQLNNGTDGNGLEFEGRVQVVLPKGGELIAGDSLLSVKGATEALVLVSMATGYFDEQFQNRIASLLHTAGKKNFATLKKEHLGTYQRFYQRVDVNLGDNRRASLPIDERLSAYAKDGNDPGLAALYFKFGRYLLISSTRPGLLPPNLQGLWCNTIHTPWNGDYHLNINLQMNLWPAEVTNLSELHLPFIRWTMQQVESGERTANVFYNARGWVTHILGNVWEFTAPGEHPSWGATNTSAAWLCAHLYQHYEFSPDKAYLREVYPVLKGAALFFVDMLVEDPRTHYLVTAPTTSPENAFYLENGSTANISAGSTMDNQLIRELFTNTIRAAAILETDSAFAEELSAKRARLMPTTIGRDGRIMEWLQPYQEVEPRHRHVSHLYGLYPGNEITVEHTPDLAEASRRTLEVRGDQSTGWSMAWKINFRARLQDGNHALKLLSDLLHPCLEQGERQAKKGGTYPNLFCSHPPFQIDGNLGAVAGIAEMLIQSHTGRIVFLPALPDAWEKGYFKGLKVRGGGEVSAKWNNKQIREMSLKASLPNTYTIQLPTGSSQVKVYLNGSPVSLPVTDGLIEVSLRAGEELLLTF